MSQVRIAGALAAGLVVVTLPAMALAAGLNYTAALNGTQETPSNASPGIGYCIVTLSLAETQISGTCSFSGLVAGTTGAHIHGGAAGVGGGIVFPLAPPLGVTSGTFVIAPTAVSPAQVTQLKGNLLYVNIHSSTFVGGEIRGQLKISTTTTDRDGDGKSDPVVYRPSTLQAWTSSLFGATAVNVGSAGDQYLNSQPGDFDGDGIGDLLLVRNSGGTRVWVIHQSLTGTVKTVAWGISSSDTLAPADYDGDGIVDIAVFRRASATWYILQSTGGMRAEPFGSPSDFPITGDYDKDGRADLAVMHASGGQFQSWIQLSNGGLSVVPWGLDNDGVFFFAPHDVDGDGAQDRMVVRTGGPSVEHWFLRSSDGQPQLITWGLGGDTFLYGDYDGDGKGDVVARRSINGSFVWFVRRSSDGGMTVLTWGVNGDQ